MTQESDSADAIPVILITQARPEHLARVIAAPRADRVIRILSFSDGLRSAAEAILVARSRVPLDAIDWCEVEKGTLRGNWAPKDGAGVA